MPKIQLEIAQKIFDILQKNNINDLSEIIIAYFINKGIISEKERNVLFENIKDNRVNEPSPEYIVESKEHEDISQIKNELIEWIRNNNNLNLIIELNEIKNNQYEQYFELNDEQKESIKKGLEDIETGNVIPHEEIVKKYGL